MLLNNFKNESFEVPPQVIESFYPIRRKLIPKLSSLNDLKILESLIPEPTQFVTITDRCKICHQKKSGNHNCPQYMGLIINCPGFDRCPTAWRKKHLNQVDSQPITAEDIQKRIEMIRKQREKVKVKKTREEKSKKHPRESIIDKLCLERMPEQSRADWLQELCVKGKAISQQLRTGKEFKAIIEEITSPLKVEENNKARQ